MPTPGEFDKNATMKMKKEMVFSRTDSRTCHSWAISVNHYTPTITRARLRLCLRSIDLLIIRKNFGRKDTSGYWTTLLAPFYTYSTTGSRLANPPSSKSFYRNALISCIDISEIDCSGVKTIYLLRVRRSEVSSRDDMCSTNQVFPSKVNPK